MFNLNIDDLKALVGEACNTVEHLRILHVGSGYLRVLNAVKQRGGGDAVAPRVSVATVAPRVAPA